MGSSSVVATERPTFSVSACRTYLQCPRMYYFERVISLDKETTSFSALFGIAVHDAISSWHTLGRRDPATTVIRDYNRRLHQELNRAQAKGLEVTGYDGGATLDKAMFTATMMLEGYVADPRNAVKLEVNEYRFEVPVVSSAGTVYNFVGYIDQVRRYPDDTLHVIDLKTGKTRPSDHLLTLDEQLSLYALACVKGRFRARRDAEWFTIGERPATVQLAMLRDYETYQKNQYAETIKDPEKTKVLNPKTNRKVIREIPNPKFEEGYKKGERKGPVFYRSLRSDFDLRQAEIDLARVAGAIRLKQFFRRPDERVCGYCRFQKPCVEERAEPI